MTANKLLLWIIPKNNSIKYVTKSEKESAETLNPQKKRQYLQSRSHLRETLSYFLKMEPNNVPLFAKVGIIPYIPNNLGYISLSHSENASLIGWSTYKLGVDIEKYKRNFNAEKISRRYFAPKEQNSLKKIKNNADFKDNVLKYWVLKEAVIKLHQGGIAKDLSNWQIEKNQHKAFNNKLKINSYVKNILFDEWVIGIASDILNLAKINIIICNSISK